LILPTYSGGPDALGGIAVVARGLTGSLRGIRLTTADGTTIRPDLIIIDDPQTDESAHSPDQVNTREGLIRGAVLNMAGPNKAIAAVANMTVIAPGDVADRLLDTQANPDWRGVRFKLVYQWPKAQATLWKEYADLRREGLRQGDRGAAATAFYVAHRAEMDEGARVGWEHRFRPGELSAIQYAENMLCDRGETVFEAEFQNEPKELHMQSFDITEELILSRATEWPRDAAPAQCDFIVAGVDINYCGLNYCILAARPDAAAWVVRWGKHPEGRDLIDKRRSSGMTEAQAIGGAIVELAAWMDKLEIRIGERVAHVDSCFFDAGFLTETVLQAIGSIRLPMHVYGCRGTRRQELPHSKGRVAVRRRLAFCPMARGKGFHRERGPLARTDATRFPTHPRRRRQHRPTRRRPRDHLRLATEICAEHLVEHVTTAAGDYYRWTRTPTVANDLLDALTYAAAGIAARAPTPGEGKRLGGRRQARGGTTAECGRTTARCGAPTAGLCGGPRAWHTGRWRRSPIDLRPRAADFSPGTLRRFHRGRGPSFSSCARAHGRRILPEPKRRTRKGTAPCTD